MKVILCNKWKADHSPSQRADVPASNLKRHHRWCLPPIRPDSIDRWSLDFEETLRDPIPENGVIRILCRICELPICPLLIANWIWDECWPHDAVLASQLLCISIGTAAYVFIFNLSICQMGYPSK
jgi:hypothetical protein